jgi:hypothetical protein
MLLTGCDVDSDAGNHISVNYDQQRIEKAAKDAGRAAKEVGSGVGNVASSTAAQSRMKWVTLTWMWT